MYKYDFPREKLVQRRYPFVYSFQINCVFMSVISIVSIFQISKLLVQKGLFLLFDNQGQKDQELSIEHVCPAVQPPVNLKVKCWLYTPVIYISYQSYFVIINKFLYHLKIIHHASQVTGDINTHEWTWILINNHNNLCTMVYFNFNFDTDLLHASQSRHLIHNKVFIYSFAMCVHHTF